MLLCEARHITGGRTGPDPLTTILFETMAPPQAPEPAFGNADISLSGYGFARGLADAAIVDGELYADEEETRCQPRTRPRTNQPRRRRSRVNQRHRRFLDSSGLGFGVYESLEA